MGYTGSLTVKLELEPGELADRFKAINLFGVHSRGSQFPKPRFVYYYERMNMENRPRLSVLRFDRLNLPRGATITKAHMESETWHNPRELDPSNLEIRAEDSGDSAPLTTARRGLSGREPTSAAVNWNPPRFYGDPARKKTPDIASLIQEVVNRDDWCAGNALSILIDGVGTRYAFNHEAGKLRAASLHVSYDPNSVDVANNCRTVSGKGALVMNADDSVIENPDGTLDENAVVLDTQNLTTSWMGIQFDNVRLSPGDKIAEAILSVTSADRSNGRTYLEATVATSAFDEGFDVNGVSAKMSGESNWRWRTALLSEGDRIESDDIAPLIQAAIDSPEWTRESTLWVGLRRYAGGPASIITTHGISGEGPKLTITKQLSGAAAADIPLRTVRDEIIERIETLPANGNTPLVDAFLETAAYMEGDEVLHGKRRGEQADYNTVHRISSEDSYTDGYVYRPIGCTADNLDDPVCAGSEIRGSATYEKPDSSECRPNQIVLVTDGDPTTSSVRADTSARIKSMAGIADCEVSSPAQECAVDLAAYLSSEDSGRHPVKVSTIGFEFQSGFLGAVAEAGGGDFHSVASSGQMSEALRAIGNDVEHDIATAVAPVAAISQFNRATHRDELYFALFEPTYNRSLWKGNVKRYGLGKLPDSDKIGVIDANGNAALDKSIGSISPNARSFWSHTVDGSDVRKGGAAEQLVSSRNILTFPEPSEYDNHGERILVAFDVTNDDITAADLNVPDSDREDAINWMRGVDVRDENEDNVFFDARRRMGAAMHTTPVVLNYGSAGAPGDSIVFAGTHEGFVHAFDSVIGEELFAFIPHELYSNVGQFFRNEAGDMRHGIDGPLTIWGDDKNQDGMIDASAGERAWLTFGLRRGGKHYYTLEITDPHNPKLAWSIDNTKPGFENLHQSWSKAIHTRIKRAGTTTNELRDVLIFGNGYNPVNDNLVRDPDAAHQDSGSVYIVDAKTGDLVHRLDAVAHRDMIWSIPSDIAVVDFDFDGAADILLVGDLGGNLWRIDIQSNTDSTGAVTTRRPTVTLAASLADRFSLDADDLIRGDRRFFNSPDVAYMATPEGNTFLGVVIELTMEFIKVGSLNYKTRVRKCSARRLFSMAVLWVPPMFQHWKRDRNASPNLVTVESMWLTLLLVLACSKTIQNITI